MDNPDHSRRHNGGGRAALSWFDLLINAFQRLLDQSLQTSEIPSFASLNEILMPVVLYFTGDVSVRTLPVLTALDVDSVNRSKAFGSQQTSFIIAHEIGHTALGHLNQAQPTPLANRPGFSSAATTVDVFLRKRQDEFAADLYAYSAVRAKFMRRMRNDPEHWDGYLSMIALLPTSIGLLFAYLHCINALSQRLRSAKNSGIPYLPEVEEHPEPRTRMENVLRNSPFDLFWSPETVEAAWHFANEWVNGINAIDDQGFAGLLAEATNRSSAGSHSRAK
jgi:hypothetical protein